MNPQQDVRKDLGFCAEAHPHVLLTSSGGCLIFFNGIQLAESLSVLETDYQNCYTNVVRR